MSILARWNVAVAQEFLKARQPVQGPSSPAFRETKLDPLRRGFGVFHGAVLFHAIETYAENARSEIATHGDHGFLGFQRSSGPLQAGRLASAVKTGSTPF
jgi:hypothetical protein